MPQVEQPIKEMKQIHYVCDVCSLGYMEKRIEPNHFFKKEGYLHQCQSCGVLCRLSQKYPYIKIND